jgi:glycosyltransferase involved in cell wall biosynthesis
MQNGELEERAELVSVVIPAYNAEYYLARTLDSVLAQTHGHIEVLVVNDGSTDGTLGVADEYAARDTRVRVYSTVNQGVAAARNHGISLAKGDFVAFVDADDLWHRTKIEKQLAKLRPLDPQWAAVYTLHRVIDQHDHVIKDGPTSTARGFILGQHLAMKFIRNGSTLLVRREAAIAVGGFEPGYAAHGIGGCEDLDFEFRIAAKYKLEAVPEMLVGYRRYFGNMSSNRVRMALSLIAATHRCLNDNPRLSKMVLKHAHLSAHQYAFMNFSNGLDFKRAAKSLAVLARYSPPMAAYAFASVAFYYFPKKVARSLLTALGVSKRNLMAPARSFLDLSPDDMTPDIASKVLKSRLQSLEALDKAYEREQLSGHFADLRAGKPVAGGVSPFEPQMEF